MGRVWWRYWKRVRDFRKQGNGAHSVEIQPQADTAVQLWQWQREREATEKINIILETLVIHFLSHLLGHLML